MRLNALFRLAFATAPPHGLTLPHTITRRLILQKARGHFTSARRPTALPRLVGARFQVLFHDPSPGSFSPFPHGTGSLSVTREYLALGGGPPGFPRDFSCPAVLGISKASQSPFAYRAFTFCGGTSQNLRLEDWFLTCRSRTHRDPMDPATPSTQRVRAYMPTGLGCSPFARRYWGNHCC